MEARTKHYVINMPPVAWQRPRLNRQTRFFDNQAKTKLVVGISLDLQHNKEPLFNGPIDIELYFYFKPPKTKKPTTHHVKPDVDNLVKFILDTIKDVLISDDKIICSIHAHKLYDQNPRTEFTITEVQ